MASKSKMRLIVGGIYLHPQFDAVAIPRTSSLDFPQSLKSRLILVSEGPKIATSRTNRRTIAVVEDEDSLLETYATLLKSLGFTDIFLAEDAERLVGAIGRGEVDPGIIVMDYRLPKMNGIQAARRILKGHPKIRIIITTADDSVKQEAVSAGMGFLQKPFSLSALATTLKRD